MRHKRVRTAWCDKTNRRVENKLLGSEKNSLRGADHLQVFQVFKQGSYDATHALPGGERLQVTRRFSQKLCPTFQSAESLLCKRWTTLIVEVLLRHPRRFNELLADLEVVSDRMLSERLKELELADVVLRRVLPHTPLRVEYSLTPKGQDLAPVIEAMRTWSERYRSDAAAPKAAAAASPLPVAKPLQSLGVTPQPSTVKPVT